MEVQSVFEGLDFQARGIAERIPAEVRACLDDAFRRGDADVSMYTEEFSKLNPAQQEDVFKFLLIMDDVAGKGLCRHYVERGFNPNSGYISAINKCIVAFKLLQAISFFIGGADRVRFYGEYVCTYMDMRETYEAIISMRSAAAKKVEGVEGGTEELDVC